jgi:cobyrinic acid a,c-diamide synthase
MGIEINQNSIPRIVLGAMSSGSGKTLVTCGLLQALMNRQYKVASFKCGPDYIDPMFHSHIIGTKSRNLDSFFTDDNTLKFLLDKNSMDMDISVIEGVMGYYDGLSGITTKGSTYDIARITNSPVILIINGKGMSLSMVPAIKGFMDYKEDSNIVGVILNNMSPMFYETIKNKIEEELHLDVFGYVPKLEHLTIESRHLGLKSPEEVDGLKEKINELAKVLENTIEIDKIISAANNAKDIKYHEVKKANIKEKVRIGIAKDKAFSFYYEDNLDLLKSMGATLEFFSPLEDKCIPEVDGLFIGGGYPELYAKKLSHNISMRDSIKKAINSGMPCIAECGGFMYLHSELEGLEVLVGNEKVEKKDDLKEVVGAGNKKVKSYPMVGIIKGKAYKTERLQRFGYIELEAKKDSMIGKAGISFQAHEFHYFDSEIPGSDFVATKPINKRSYDCIHSSENLMAGFPHLYLYSNIEIAKNYIEACRKFRYTMIEKRDRSDFK